MLGFPIRTFRDRSLLPAPPDFSQVITSFFGSIFSTITLGVAVARLETKAMTQAVWLSAVKVVICVGAAWGAAAWFGLDPIAAAVLIVQVATPVAVTSYLLAEKYGADAQPVAGLVVASTLLSVIYLPLILAFVI